MRESKMNQFELALTKYLKPEQLQQIQKIKVGIAGAGGLGSNCALNLVRSGLKRLVVVDFDNVELSNLNRQFYFMDQAGQPKVTALKSNLLRINPDLEIIVFQEKIEPNNIGSFFNDCQVVVEAFDQPEYKRMLVEYYLNSTKLIISASGLAGWEGADRIITHNLRDQFYLIGDLSTEVDQDQPPLSPKVNIAAAKQANVVLQWTLNNNSRRRFPDTDLYCITAHKYSLGRSNQEVVKQMLEAGIKLVQYREKEFTMLQKYRESLIIRDLTADYDACLIINDDLHLALAVEADGVHLGQDDLPVEKAREIAGDKMLIGLSTHAPEQAGQAIKLGVDYIGVGPIYQTYTKKDVCAPVGLEYLDYVVNNHQIPFVAIGGIKQSNVAEVVKHGATCIGMVTEIVGAENIGAKIKAIRAEILKDYA